MFVFELLDLGCFVVKFCCDLQQRSNRKLRFLTPLVWHLGSGICVDDVSGVLKSTGIDFVCEYMLCPWLSFAYHFLFVD